MAQDRTRTRIGYCEIPLSSLSEEPGEIDQIKFDKLYELGNGRSTVRIALQWIYSTVKLLEDILQQVRVQTQDDKDQLTVFRNDIAAMQNPFETFIKGGELMLMKEGQEKGLIHPRIERSLEVGDNEERWAKQIDNTL